MVIRKARFFLVLVVLVIVPLFLYKAFWLLSSEKAIGKMRFRGKSYDGQIVRNYSVISFNTDHETIWFNSSDNIFFAKGVAVPVRYHPSQPADARIDMFVEIWGDVLIVGGILFLIIGMAFFHPDVVPWGSSIRLSRSMPFISLIPKQEKEV